MRMILKLITCQCLIDFMLLSNFEIAVGGIMSIPVVGGLVFLGYKSFGEKNLDTSKLKPKKVVAKKKDPTPKSEASDKPAKKAETSSKAEASSKAKTTPKTENSKETASKPNIESKPTVETASDK